eukprot:1213455-Pyramimonas_sp.AAC.1
MGLRGGVRTLAVNGTGGPAQTNEVTILNEVTLRRRHETIAVRGALGLDTDTHGVRKESVGESNSSVKRWLDKVFMVDFHLGHFFSVRGHLGEVGESISPGAERLS